MRLINVETLQLEELLDYKTPPYAILSHTWGDDAEELTFRDIEEDRTDKPGVGCVKLRGSCQQTKKNGLRYVWIDTCCIDKANLVELSEAINSMFRWYQRASICYAYYPTCMAMTKTRGSLPPSSAQAGGLEEGGLYRWPWLYISLMTTPASETIGLLNCGPENSPQQVVGLPLVRVSGASDEYFRPMGCYAVLQRIT